MSNPEIERIRLRCVCDGEGESPCWLWDGSCNAQGLPTVNRQDEDGKLRTRSARRWVFEQANGVKLSRKDIVSLSCENDKCLQPKHLKRTTRGAVQRKTNATNPAVKLRRATSLRATRQREGGHKLDAERADYARDRSRPAKVAAQELGVSVTLVNHIRAGKVWRSTGCAMSSMVAALA